MGHRCARRIALHQAMKAATNLNCSIGIGTSRLIAKVCSDQAKPNGMLQILPGGEMAFLGAARCAKNSRGRQGNGEAAE